MMKQILIATATATILLCSGMPWLAVGIAIATLTFLAHGSTAVQSWIERRTGRKPQLKSEAYAATYFAITLGLSLPAICFFPDLHPLGHAMIMLTGSTAGTMVATSLFGTLDCDDAKQK